MVLLALVALWVLLALVVPPALVALQTVEGLGVSPDVVPLVATVDLLVCSLVGEAEVVAGAADKVAAMAAGEMAGQTVTWSAALPAFAALRRRVSAALVPCPW